MRGSFNRWLAAFGLLALVPCLAAPISNPDLFWHLSAARRILELGSIPKVDWLSSTLSGEPWTDFEWLQQLLYSGIYAMSGMAGLWVLKILLMLAALGVLWKTLGLYGVATPYRWTAVAFWGAASLSRSDLRPEWASVILFGALFWWLEAQRLGRRTPKPVWALALFAAWANLHPGFAYGLLLIGIYGAAQRERKSRRYLLALFGWSAAGTLLQPFGIDLYRVFWQHWRQLSTMQNYIYEWVGLGTANFWHIPYWVLLIASVAVGLRVLARRGYAVLAPFASLSYFSLAVLRHVRFAAYQVTLATPLTDHWAMESGVLSDPPSARARWTCLAAIALLGAYSGFHARIDGTFERVFSDKYVPILATRFLDSEKDTLSPLNLYNDQHGWGGYLGYRLYPRYRIFADGRYIFHPLLQQAGDAIASDESWDKFLARYQVQLAIMENIPRWMKTKRLLPDGSTIEFQRPYYTVFMPKAEWALVYWDEKALIFVRRGSVEPRWIDAHEYRLALPFDDAARNDALARGEIRREPVDAEFRRHFAELSAMSRAED